MHLLKLKDKSTPSVTIDSGGLSCQVDSQVNNEKTPNAGKPQDADNTTQSSRKLVKKQVMRIPTTEISSEAKCSNLDQEWDQFNQKLQGTPKSTITQETEECKTPLHVHKDTEPKSVSEQSKPVEEQATTSQHAEIILSLPTLEIVLKVTEIPQLDVFYSPLHKAIVRRQRKMRRVDTPEFPPGNK